MAWENPVTTWGQAGQTVPGAGDFNRIEGNTQYLKDEVDSHKTDYTLQVPFGGTTTNSGNNYSIASPAISALTAGMAIAVKINANSTGATTLNWNGKGAKPIKKANGTDVTNLKAGGIYTLRYDGTNFILQGEGASGNATASDLLSGKTATTDAGEIVGTMPNRGAVANTITTQDGQYTIPAGYHNGAGKVTASFANLVAANIKKGVNIGGVVGSLIPIAPTPLVLYGYGSGHTRTNQGAMTPFVIGEPSYNNMKVETTTSGSGTFACLICSVRGGECGWRSTNVINLSNYNKAIILWRQEYGNTGIYSYFGFSTQAEGDHTTLVGTSNKEYVRHDMYIGSTSDGVVSVLDISDLSGNHYCKVHLRSQYTDIGTLNIYSIMLI